MATFTVIVSFLPMFFVTGMMGPYMRPMPFNVPMAMLMSLVVAFTVTPWATYHFLKGEYDKEHEEVETKETLTHRVYSRIMTPLLEKRRNARIFLQDEQVEYEHDMEADAERYLNYVNELAAKKGVSVTRKYSKGTVHKEIIDAITDEEIDLLVIGELARIRSRRDEFYDESERAMRAAGCSVLIVKDEDRVWELYESLG